MIIVLSDKKVNIYFLQYYLETEKDNPRQKHTLSIVKQARKQAWAEPDEVIFYSESEKLYLR